MNPNLKWKFVFIVLVILGCIYGLVGLPTFPTSGAQLKNNFSHQIKLGLDLQGGTHLVLQVQTQEAIAQETDQMVERITSWLRTKNIRYDEVRRVDDTHILVRSVDSARLSEFRDYISQQFSNFWDMSPAAGDPSGYTLTLRGAAIAQIQETTMTLSLETIDRRINALGLTEPTIQPCRASILQWPKWRPSRSPTRSAHRPASMTARCTSTPRVRRVCPRRPM